MKIRFTRRQGKWATGLAIYLILLVVLAFKLPTENLLRRLVDTSADAKSLNLINHGIFIIVLATGLFAKKTRSYLFPGFIIYLSISVFLNAFRYNIKPNFIVFPLIAILTLNSMLKREFNFDFQDFPKSDLIIGALSLVFGFWYLAPLVENPIWLNAMLYSPVGAVNCPTLLTSIGLLILNRSPRPKILCLVATLATYTFGGLGLIRLGIYVDTVLLISSTYFLYHLIQEDLKNENDQKPMSWLAFKVMTFIMTLRKKYRKIEEEVNFAGIKSGNNILDFGCGLGFNSIPAAQKVGNSGRVFALDINLRAINIVEQKSKKHHLKNIETILSSCHTNLDDDSIDIIYLHNTLPLVKYKWQVMHEIIRVLKVGGKLSYMSRSVSRAVGDDSMNDEKLKNFLVADNAFKLVKEKNGHLIFEKLKKNNAQQPSGNKSKIAYRDREEPRSSPLPHHAAYGSVLRDPRPFVGTGRL